MLSIPSRVRPGAGLLFLLLAACGASDDDDGGDGPSTGPLYLAASWVSDADSASTYIAVFDSLDRERLDFTDAIELPGYADAWAYEGKVFIAEGEAPVLHRYVLSAAGKLEPEAEVSFVNFGAVSPSFYNNQILSPTKAYLANDAAREYIVWNPTTMEITGTVPWPAVTFAEGLDPFHSYTDRGGVVHGNLYFHAIYGHNEFWDGFGDRSYVAVYDITTDALVDTIEVPCPMMDVASVGDDGYLYLSGWSYMPLSITVERSATNCAARIDLATRQLDAGWTMTYPEVTGDEGSALRAVDGNQGILAVFHGSGVPITEGMDMWDLDAADDDWELYAIELDTKAVTPTGVRFGDGSFYETHIDERYFVYLGQGEDTQVYERTAGGYEARFLAEGWLSRFFQLR